MVFRQTPKCNFGIRGVRGVLLSGISLILVLFICLAWDEKTRRWCVVRDRDAASKKCEISKLPFPVHSTVTKTQPPYKIFLHDPSLDVYVSEELIRYGVWEPHTLKLFHELSTALAPQNVIYFDFGGNIGAHALYMAAHGYEVHSFEPMPHNFLLLQCSAVANNFSTLFIYNVALSSEVGPSLCMSIPSGNQGGSFIKPSNASGCDALVPVTTLDEYVQVHLGPRRVTLMKMDAEGFEPKILLGARNLLKVNPPMYLYIEVSPFLTLRSSQMEAIPWLLSLFKYGYRVVEAMHKGPHFRVGFGDPLPSEKDIAQFISESAPQQGDVLFKHVTAAT